jgi:hypothetical protein
MQNVRPTHTNLLITFFLTAGFLCFFSGLLLVLTFPTDETTTASNERYSNCESWTAKGLPDSWLDGLTGRGWHEDTGVAGVHRTFELCPAPSEVQAQWEALDKQLEKGTLSEDEAKEKTLTMAKAMRKFEDAQWAEIAKENQLLQSQIRYRYGGVGLLLLSALTIIPGFCISTVAVFTRRSKGLQSGWQPKAGVLGSLLLGLSLFVTTVIGVVQVITYIIELTSHGNWSHMSDRRLKTEIVHEGTSPSGIPRYSFQYRNDPSRKRYHGTMAQDLLDRHPEAVQLRPDGTYAVHYDRIDVDFYMIPPHQ